jgi:DNA repair exonuclease SbcCD ATPase subunit
VDHYRELLLKAAGELAAEASAAGGHGELLRRLFSMRDTAARKDAEGLVWRLLGLAKDSTPSEPDGFPSKLITAVDRLRFQLPIPHALPPAVAGGAPSAASSTPRPEQAMQAELEQLRRNEQAANASIQDWRRKYEMLLAKVRQLEMRATPSDSVPQDGAEPSSSAKKEVDGLRSEAEALRRQLSQAHKEQEGLTRRLKQAEESRAQVLQVQDAALSEVRSLKVKVEAGQREGARLQEERDQQKSLAVVSAKLVSALEREKAELTKQETELRRRITKLETRVGATEGQLATSAAEIQRLEALVAARQADVTRLERTCERWLRAEPELQEVRALFSRVRLAVVELRSRYPKDEVTDKTALLLFYSLANLTLATSSGETVLRAAMLVNLRQIASSLQACPHFPAMSGALARIDPRIATLHEEWSTSAEARPGRELFQRSVQCLRARHALELESFYYDVDEQERVCLTG